MGRSVEGGTATDSRLVRTLSRCTIDRDYDTLLDSNQPTPRGLREMQAAVEMAHHFGKQDRDPLVRTEWARDAVRAGADSLGTCDGP